MDWSWLADMIKKFGFKQLSNIAGIFKFDGVLLSGRHPAKITISTGTLDFLFVDGDKEFVRSFALERSGGKIVAFTNPDGARTEVVRSE